MPTFKPPLFEMVAESTLLSYGVPAEWLPDVRAVDEDSLLALVAHLPAEAAEALLELATGGTPQPVARLVGNADPFAHPDAQRRFRIMTDVEELEQALEYPWEKWTVFLHPAQRQWVERDHNGPARVAGSAGTGKTIVALHRAVHLARQYPDSRVLLATFSTTLANMLRNKLRSLISNQPRLAERLEVHAMDAIGRRLYEQQFGRIQFASDAQLRELLQQAASKLEGSRPSLQFLFTEWRDVVDAWQLDSWEAYRDVRRLGRKTRLPEAQRQQLWQVFAGVRSELQNRNLLTRAAMFFRLAEHMVSRKQPPFDFAVVDEAQDISVAQLRFLAALGAERPNGLFFAGDLGQRIFQQPFSWKALGVDVRGRARTLHINYRTSHQIRSKADRLLGPEVGDVDGNVETRKGTVSVFNGPAPTIRELDSVETEHKCVSDWLATRIQDGLLPHEISVFVRSESELERAKQAVAASGLAFKVLDEHVEGEFDRVSISTMHLAKGLEYRAVVVMACDDEIIPSQARLEAVADQADLEEIYNTERHLLYVACTRARDHLLVTSGGQPSEFLADVLTD